MKIDFNQILKDLEVKAKTIYEDNEKLKSLLNSTIKLIQENKQLNEVVQDIRIMIHPIRDWVNGDYKELSNNTVLLVVIALLYLVMPLDLIPDFLPMGFIDDIAVIGFVMKRISDEINKYKEWKYTFNENFSEDIIEEEESGIDDDFYIEL